MSHLKLPRFRQSVLQILCLASTMLHCGRVGATVIPKSPTIVFSSSDDFPEMSFVVYGLKLVDPWELGTRLDSKPPEVLKASKTITLPFGSEFAVLAVPAELMEKTDGVPDPAWLDPSTPGVYRMPEVLRVPRVFWPITLEYQLQKVNDVPSLVLLNEQELVRAKQEPMDTSAELPKPPPPWFEEPLFRSGFLLGGLIGLIIAGSAAWFIFTLKTQS